MPHSTNQHTQQAPAQPGVKPMTLLTARQAAARLSVSISTIERLVRKKVLPLHRVGPRGPRRFHLHDVDRALIPASSLDERDANLDALIASTVKG